MNLAVFHQQTAKNIQRMNSSRLNPGGTSRMFGSQPIPADGPPGPVMVEDLIRSFDVTSASASNDWFSNGGHLISFGTDPGNGMPGMILTYVDPQGNPCDIGTNNIRIFPENEFRVVISAMGLIATGAVDGFLIGTDANQYGSNFLVQNNVIVEFEDIIPSIAEAKEFDMALTFNGSTNITPPATPDSVVYYQVDIYRPYLLGPGWWDNWTSNQNTSVNWNWLGRNELLMMEVEDQGTAPYYIEYNEPLVPGQDYRITGGAALNRNDGQFTTGIIIADSSESVVWLDNNNIGEDTFLDFDVTMTAGPDSVLRIFSRNIFNGSNYIEPRVASCILFSEITVEAV